MTWAVEFLHSVEMVWSLQQKIIALKGIDGYHLPSSEFQRTRYEWCLVRAIV